MPEGELQLDALLDRRESQLRQSVDRWLRELLVGEVGERVAPPQRLGFGEQRDRLLRVVARRRGAGGRDQLLVLVDVDGVGGQIEDVAAAAHHDQIRGPEGVAQLRRQRLQPVAHTWRRILAPQRIDDLFRWHDPPGVHGEERKQRLLLARRDSDVPIIRITNFEFAKKPDPHNDDGIGILAR